MIVLALKDATQEQLRKHYQETPVTRKEFDNIRPLYYDVTGKQWGYDPLIEHYRSWLLKKGIRAIVIQT